MIGPSSFCNLRCQMLSPLPGRFGGNALKRRLCYAAGAAFTISSAGALFGGGAQRNARTRAEGGPETFGSEPRRVTDVLIVTNVIAFVLQLATGNRLIMAGAKVNELIRQGEYYRFISAAFLHGDFLHLGFNCNALYQLGPLVELTSGHLRFLTIYLGSAIAGTAMSYFCSPHPSIGASGAIFGVAGALAMFAWQHREMMGPSADSLLMRLRDTAAINLMYGVFFRRIDNWGHLGGLLGGAVLSYLLGPRLVYEKNRKGKVVIADRPPIGILATRSR